MKKRNRKFMANILSAAMMASSLSVGLIPTQVKALQRPGTAPYINTWLVAGPTDTSVVDGIYGEAPIERPADGNWASVAEVSSSSTWQTNAYDYPGNSPEAKVAPAKAIDGNKGTEWISQMHDAESTPDKWPKWDPEPKFYLEWNQPIKVKTVQFYDRHNPAWTQPISNITEVRCTLWGADGDKLAEKTVTEIDPLGANPGVAEFDEAIEGVAKVELAIIHDGVKEYRNVGLGFTEVEVYDGEQIDEPEIGTPEKLINMTVTASTTLNSESGAAKAIDGSVDTAWKSNTRQGIVWDNDLSLTLDLNEVSYISALKVKGFERDNKRVGLKYTLLNEKQAIVKTGSLDDIISKEGVIENINASNVKYIVLKPQESGGCNHVGIREVEVWGQETGSTGEPEPEPTVKITPELGEQFGESTESTWQYFDDRIFNRNTDDYQDLYGYFNVKQGLDVKDKYTYAHTYVYSPKEQNVQLRFVTTGLHKVYVNDRLVHENNEAVESSDKDYYKQNVALKEGWNKLLIEIEQDRVHYLGFYARICSPDSGTASGSAGNPVEGLIYSVEGPTEGELTITTQGLDIDQAEFEVRNVEMPHNQYPENELPKGYVEWPYVWNKTIHQGNAHFGPQAAKFQFNAAGGSPSYTWEIIEGSLPDGLTLNKDGTIDGYCEKIGEYPFKIQVTDKNGDKATKSTKIIVDERPNKWFEEGKMSALTHCAPVYNLYFDENYSIDLWAERAKNAGMTMLSVEGIQGPYHWPAPNSHPDQQDPRTTEIVDGKLQVKDALMPFKEATERHGMKFGVYYAGEGGWQFGHRNSTAFVEDVEDLMKRYDPKYLFFDGGPQGYGNTDAMWSIVRNFNDYTLIQANDQKEVSDNDITILEATMYFETPYTHGGYWETNMLQQNKYTVEEVWRHPFTKEYDGWSGYHGGQLRDDWRMWAKAIIDDIGHGYVTNYDQMIVMGRGDSDFYYNYNPRNIKDPMSKYSIHAQDFITMRDGFNYWLAQPGKPDKRQSLYGTMPYTFDYEKKEGWHDDPELAFKYGEGPEWGYAVSRDNQIYMHMIENQIGKGKNKVGFTEQSTVEAGPFTHEVTNVEWLNEGVSLDFTPTVKDGKYYITIDTSNVKADPIDTIIKVTTADTARAYQLTSVKTFSDRIDAQNLQLTTESYMNDFTSVFAPADITFSSSDTSVATVNDEGVVTAVADGQTTIQVTATYEGVTKTDEYPIKVDANNNISPDLELLGIVMKTGGQEIFGEFSPNNVHDITFEGRTVRGGGIDLSLVQPEDITYHYATVDKKGQTTEIDESDSLIKVEDGKLIFTRGVTERTDVAYWADITVDGQTFTTNKMFMWVYPSNNLSLGIVPEVSSGTGAAYTTDGIINTVDGANNEKWTADKADKADKNPSLTYDLGVVGKLSGVEVDYNNEFIRYINAPKAIQIEVSDDNQNWRTVVENGSVPTNKSTIYNWEDNVYTYKFEDVARYVRITFPGGAQSGDLDVLEVKVLGLDYSNALTKLEVRPVLSEDGTSATVDLTGYSGLDEELDLTDATVKVVSSDTSIVSVDEKGTMHAVAPGKVRIDVAVTKEGYRAEDYFYLTVDEQGKMSAPDYLKTVEIAMDSQFVDVDTPINVEAKGLLNTGVEADLAEAKVECTFSDSRLVFDEETRQIKIQGPVDKTFSALAEVTVTLDGVKVAGEPFSITVVNYSSLEGIIEAESGVLEGKAVRTEEADGGTVVAFVTEGDTYTYYVKAEEAGQYELTYREATPNAGKKVEMWVNDEKQATTPVKVTGDWGAYQEVKHDGLITLQEGVNKIQIRPTGSGYIFNLNWFKLEKVENPEASTSIVLSGDSKVKPSETLTMQVALGALNDKVYAQDITLNYDPELFVLETITAEGKTEIAGTKRDDAKGQVTILTGSPDGIAEAKDLLTVTFRAKSANTAKDTSITATGKLGLVENNASTALEVDLASHSVQVEAGEVDQVDKAALEAAIQNAEQIHANAEEGTNPGQYPEGAKAKLMAAIEVAKGVMNNATTQVEVDQALTSLNQSVQEFIDSQIKESGLVGDINKDGKIDVADLGLVAYYYMAKVGDDNWDKAQVADVAKNGMIDIGDLSLVANKILEK